MKKLLFISLLFFSVLIFNKCDKTWEWGYMVVPEYDIIRSYPGGGGVYILYNDCATYEGYTFDLSIEADPQLNASLSKTRVSFDDPVFEIIITPDADCKLKDYKIYVTAKCTRPKGAAESSTAELIVQVSDWGCNKENASEKLQLFKDYLLAMDPNYKEIFETPEMIYSTYTDILIVEHFTILTENYEVRLCHHVMVQPDDWQKIRIRKRNSRYPELALHRSTDGEISILDIYDYPIFFGY